MYTFCSTSTISDVLFILNFCNIIIQNEKGVYVNTYFSQTQWSVLTRFISVSPFGCNESQKYLEKQKKHIWMDFLATVKLYFLHNSIEWHTMQKVNYSKIKYASEAGLSDNLC